MDSQDSLTIGDDFSLLAAQGMRQSMDNQTLAAPPAPLAASTVMRTQQRKKTNAVDDPRESFFTSRSSPVTVPKDGRLAQMKLSFGGLDDQTLPDIAGLTKQSVHLMEFSNTRGEIDRDDGPDDLPGNLSARSSLGILNVDALNELSASLLPVSVVQGKDNRTPSILKDSVNSSDWRDHSKQDSKDQPIGISHVVDTVKKRPTHEEAPTTRAGGPNMCLFGGGALTDVAEASEFEQSIIDVQFEDDELKMLDEDFSDIEVSDLSDEDNEGKKPALLGQTDLSDFLELERKVNEESRTSESEEEEHGQGEGQESEEDEQKITSASASLKPTVTDGLDMKFFRPSPMPPVQSGNQSARSSQHRDKGAEHMRLNLTDMRKQYVTGNGSEIDTEDELEAVRQSMAVDKDASQGRHDPRPGLEGQQNERSGHISMLLRQSAEGDVVTSPVPGDGGGGGDGSSGSEPDDQLGSRPTRQQPHRFAHGQPYPDDYDTEPKEQRVRPMGDDLLSRDDFASMSGDNNSVAGIDRFATLDDGAQNYMASTIRSEMDDSRLQSRFLAPVGQSLHFGDSVSQMAPPGNTSSFNIEDIFGPGKPNTSADSGINTANQRQGPRLDASGFNADDFPEAKDPFSAFDSSFGSFGLKNSPDAGPTDPIDHQSNTSSGLGQSFETATDRQSISAKSPRGSTAQTDERSKAMAPRKDSNIVMDSAKGATAEAAKPKAKSDADSHYVFIDDTGEGVTHLAFHKSLMKEAKDQKKLLKTETEEMELDIPEEVPDVKDFFDAVHGMAMLDDDEKEFEKENIFMQDDNMMQSQYRDVITNSTSCWDSFSSDAFLRISIGGYWATRTEDLGTLDGNPMYPRPEFGMIVKTPPGNRKPVALIEKSPGNSNTRTAGVGTEGDGDLTLTGERDNTFTIDEMSSNNNQQNQGVFKVPQPVRDSMSGQTDDKMAHSGGNSSTDSDHSMVENSGILTVSAIDSFINKMGTQSNPGELVSTIMKGLSNKNRQRETQPRPGSEAMGKRRSGEYKKHEKMTDAHKMAADRKDEEAGVFTEADRHCSPSKKGLRGSRLPIRKGSLASTYEKAWKERQKSEKPEKPEKPEKEKVPRRRSDIVQRPKHDCSERRQDEVLRDRNFAKLQTGSAVMKKCKSSSVLEKSRHLKNDLTLAKAKELQKQMSVNIKHESGKPKSSSPPIKGNSVTSEKKQNSSFEKNTSFERNSSFGDKGSDHNDSLGDEWMMPRPSLGGDFLEEHLQQMKGNAQQNLLTSYSNVPKLREKENMSDLSKMYSQKGNVMENEVDIDGLRKAIMDERQKPINKTPPKERNDQNRHDGQSMQVDVPNSRSSGQMYCDIGDTGVVGVSNVHHVPDGSEYSTVSNYLSPDKKMSRDGMVGTSDIKLAESRGFNVIGRNSQPTHDIPGSYGSTYSHSEMDRYSDRDFKAASLPNQGYLTNMSKNGNIPDNACHDKYQPPSKPESSNNAYNEHTKFRQMQQENINPQKPTLLTGQSLMKTEFAQKYLGKENSEIHHVDEVSFMTDDNAAQSFMELEPQNLSTMSHIYGSDLPSFYNQLPAYHSTPFGNTNMPLQRRPNANTAGDLIPSRGGGQYRATDGSLGSHLGNQTDESLHSTMMTPRVTPVSIEAPGIITFPDPCCVGISMETTLPLKNPSLRWLQCIIYIRELSLNGRGVDPESHCPFKMKTKLTVEPDTTENVNVMFLPKAPGAYVAQVEIFCQPFLRDENLVPSGYPTTVTLQAIAEHPMIQVVTDEEKAINFGVVTWGKNKVSTLGLRNVGKAMVPLRLAITASKSWHCFMFDKSPSKDMSLISKSNRPPSPALGKSVMNLCLKGFNSDKAVSSEDIKIYCKPPEKNAKLSQYPPDEIEARIDVEVDTPIPSLPPIASIRLQATIGVLRLHTNVDTIRLKCPVGKSVEEKIKLKNSGNLKMELQLYVPKFSDVFRVTPEKLAIPPGNYFNVSVVFEPKADMETKQYDTIFVMYLVQDGTMYELNLHGEVQLPAQKGFLLSDKAYLSFGGVALGRAKQQKLTILNNAPQSLKLSVDIRSESSCFQLQSSIGRPEEKIQRRDIVIAAQEKCPIYVLYSPDSVAAGSAKLVIKPYDLGTKFSIPLSGYGGVSSLTLDGVNKSGSDKYFVNIGYISTDNNCLSRVVLSNSGQRAAFVRAIAYEDLHCSKTLNPGRIAIDPNEFVIAPGQQKSVTVAFSPSNREMALCSEHKEIVAAVAFFHGDEVSRQKFRRGLRRERLQKPLKSLENNAVKDINFDVHFTDEESAAVVHEGLGLQDSPSDVQLFYRALSKTTLALIGETSLYSGGGGSSSMQTPPQHRTNRSIPDLIQNSPAGLLPISKSPVRLEHSRELSSVTLSKLNSPPDQTVSKDDDWEIQPDQLILTLPPRGETNITKSFQILNFARRKMNYDLCWPGHCVHVSPKQGVVNARSTTELRVSPLPSLYERPDLLPWSGTIQVNCDNQYKLLRLQIRTDVSREPTSDVTSNIVPLSTSIAPTTVHISEPPRDRDSHYVQLSTTNIKFLNTRVGESCESLLEFSNTSVDPISWTASSFAPAYVKGVDRTGDVYRVTYSVFQLNEKVGYLKPRDTAKVPVVFYPLSSGSFNQRWDIKCRIKSGVAESSITLQVNLTGEGVEVDKDVRAEKLNNTNHSNNSLSSAEKTAKKSAKDGRRSRPIQLMQTVVHAECEAGQRSTVKIQFQNRSEEAHKVEVVPSQAPFFMKHREFAIGARKMLKYPVEFKPDEPGKYEGLIVFRTDLGYSLSVQLIGQSR